MSVGLRYCEFHGWASCDGNCGNCGTTATTTTDGYWYHGSGKLGGEFCPNKPNDEEHYGEYVKIVRCKDCKYKVGENTEYNDAHCEIHERGNNRELTVGDYDYCSWGKRKEGERMIQCDDLCKTCKSFDYGEYECNKGHYLDGDKYTIECEDWEEVENETT